MSNEFRFQNEEIAQQFSDPTQWQAYLAALLGKIDDAIQASQESANMGEAVKAAAVFQSMPNFFGVEFPEIVNAELDIDFEVSQLNQLIKLSQILKAFVNQTLKEAVVAIEAGGSSNASELVTNCYRRTAEDIAIIGSAIEQREWMVDSNAKLVPNQQAGALVIADKLVLKALAPFRHLLPIAQTMIPLTFFGRDTHIHHVPYHDNYILVSLNRAHASAEITRDANNGLLFGLMAIPHEVGHFVYHHAILDDGTSFTTLCERFRNHPHYPWCEELFADTYGCMISGPISVYGLQLVLQKRLEKSGLGALHRQDGIHPTGAIRPFILTENLRILAQVDPQRFPFFDVAELLDHQWAETTGISIHEGRETVELIRPILEQYTHTLMQHVNASPWGKISEGTLSPHIPWSRGDEDGAIQMRYLHELANIAFQKVPTYSASQINAIDAEHRLRQFLSRWGDDGQHDRHTPGGGNPPGGHK